MKRRTLSALLLISAVVVPSLAAAGGGGRGLRSDNPGQICDMQSWGGLNEDPYLLFDGNSDGKHDLATYFNPGTVVTGDSIHMCGPRVPLSKQWSNVHVGNPASHPDPNTGLPTKKLLTAISGVMYEWANPNNLEGFTLMPDAEVFVWILPPSSQFPEGAFELELDNWCGPSPFFTSGSQEPPNASSSINWNGIVYTAACAGFTNGTSVSDIVLASSGVLIGYVDSSNGLHLSSTAPGWSINAP
jgi:hypothetical protein